MGYVGTAPISGDYRKLDDISSSFNASTTAFTLQVGSVNVTPPKATAVLISVGGILQEPVTAYDISGSTITFTAAPAAGADFFGVMLGAGVDIGTPGDDTVTGAKIADNAVDSEHIVAGAVDVAHMSANSVDSDQYVDGSIDTDHIADNAVTLAKLNGGTAGNIIAYDASGNPAVVATGSSGTILTSAGAGAPPTFAAAAGGGIQYASQWRMSADTTPGTLTSNWEEADAPSGYGVLGSSMTEASGVFTFPSTGYWYIVFNAAIGSSSTASNTGNTSTTVPYAYGYIYATVDADAGSPTWGVMSKILHKTYAYGPMNLSLDTIIDVTSVTTVKAKFGAATSGVSWNALGSTTSTITGATFIRLGDT